MTTKFDQIVGDATIEPSDELSWKDWKDALAQAGLYIKDGQVPLETVIKAGDLRGILESCTYELKDVEEPVADQEPWVESFIVETLKQEFLTTPTPMGIDRWRADYQALMRKPPIDENIVTEDGSMIRINMVFQPNKEPFMFTKVYIPNKVCGRLGWFAQSVNNHCVTGWQTILTQKSRDEAMRRFDITKDFGAVRSVHILDVARNNNSLIAEISAWR